MMESRKAMWEEKCWGRVNHAFYDSFVGVSCLETRAGFCCSLHHHVQRNNLFTVQSGIIAVEVIENYSIDGTNWFVLRKGDTLLIPSLVQHRFYVMIDGFLTELYTPSVVGGVRQDDIIRVDEGGSFNMTATINTLRKKGLWK